MNSAQVDGFDSNEPIFSSNGLYYPAKRKATGDIYSMGTGTAVDIRGTSKDGALPGMMMRV